MVRARRSSPSSADGLVGAVVTEVVLIAAITAAVAPWRRRWIPTLAAGATALSIVGILDVIFIGTASAPSNYGTSRKDTINPGIALVLRVQIPLLRND